MSLPILVAIVAVGIALTVAAVHFTGGGRAAEMADAREALGVFARDHPDETATMVHLTADRRAAFLCLHGGRTGIVRSFGDRYLTRIVTPKDVRDVALKRPDGVSLRLRDFTWRGGVFAFADPLAAEAVMHMLSAEKQTTGAEA